MAARRGCPIVAQSGALGDRPAICQHAIRMLQWTGSADPRAGRALTVGRDTIQPAHLIGREMGFANVAATDC